MTYAKELASLREERQRTEEIVSAIIQERDAYKAMIEEADLSSSSVTNVDKNVYELTSKVSELEDENKRLKNHNSRIIQAEELLSETLEKTKTECGSLRLELVAATSDLRFYKDRCEKIENEMKSLQSECLNTNNRRHEIEKMLIDQQKG
jgi:chromosome segregation ATPase